MTYVITNTAPAVADYNALRRSVGWSAYPEATAAAGLAGSLYHVCICDQGQLIGYGRIIGDGATVFYLQDVIIHPAYQGQRLGSAIAEALLSYLSAAADPTAIVALLAAAGTESFYRQLGFVPRDELGFGPGMSVLAGQLQLRRVAA